MSRIYAPLSWSPSSSRAAWLGAPQASRLRHHLTAAALRRRRTHTSTCTCTRCCITGPRSHTRIPTHTTTRCRTRRRRTSPYRRVPGATLAKVSADLRPRLSVSRGEGGLGRGLAHH